REYTSEPPELEFEPGMRAKRPQSTSEPRSAPPPSAGPASRSGFRVGADLLAAASIAFFGFVLVMSGVAKARQQSRVYACQNNLRTLYNGLADYAGNDPQGY